MHHLVHEMELSGSWGDDQDEVIEDYFGGAVVDNFAAIEEQEYWHRYAHT
jgi:hypothetical protein